MILKQAIDPTDLASSVFAGKTFSHKMKPDL